MSSKSDTLVRCCYCSLKYFFFYIYTRLQFFEFNFWELQLIQDLRCYIDGLDFYHQVFFHLRLIREVIKLFEIYWAVNITYFFHVSSSDRWILFLCNPSDGCARGLVRLFCFSCIYNNILNLYFVNMLRIYKCLKFFHYVKPDDCLGRSPVCACLSRFR